MHYYNYYCYLKYGVPFGLVNVDNVETLQRHTRQTATYLPITSVAPHTADYDIALYSIVDLIR